MAVTKRLRFEVLRRDGFACRYCGAKAPDVELTVDHVTPRALGGQDVPENLVAACRPCNTGKSSAGPDEHHVAQVADDALRWAAAVKEAQARLADDEDALERVAAQIDHTWLGWTYGPADNRRHIPRPDAWKQTVRSLLAAGLTPELIIESIDIAMGNDRVKADQTWRYFCGVCWRRVDELHQRAQQILEEGG